MKGLQPVSSCNRGIYSGPLLGVPSALPTSPESNLETTYGPWNCLSEIRPGHWGLGIGVNAGSQFSRVNHLPG